jgi:class 3 adenylate cyclase
LPVSTKLQRLRESVKSAAKRRRDKAKQGTEQLLGAGIATGTAYFVAMQDQREQIKQATAGDPVVGWTIADQPAPMLLGGALVALGITGLAGKQSPLIFSAGEGALLAFAAQKGREAAEAVATKRGTA